METALVLLLHLLGTNPGLSFIWSWKTKQLIWNPWGLPKELLKISEDEKETWSLTYGDKKSLYGSSNRIPVGGKPADQPENAKGPLISFVCLTV